MKAHESARDRRFSPRTNDPGPGIKSMMDRIVDLTAEKTRMAREMELLHRDVQSLRRDKTSLLTSLRNASKDKRSMALQSAHSHAEREEAEKLTENISRALQAEINGLEAELSKRPTETCVACTERPRQMAYVPCGHFVLCATCAKRWGSCCPVCKAEATTSVRIFRS